LGHGDARLIGGSGVDVASFTAATRLAPPTAQMREELGLQSAEIVMFVGRLTRQKGIPTLLEAVPKVLAKRPNARFVLIGPWQSEGPSALEEAELQRHGSNVVVLATRKAVPARP
ncbi:glycosyltransferase, partial [Mesorhizobium sp. M1C.F.Ca.ET.204.01.1.1]|uniref:glycosyltransferase n=1 Tax=Mesorhizobium sp. M1C.F.Ca.ET.204.01.1.1 TaxID=2563929 RepID=UPI001093CC16